MKDEDKTKEQLVDELIELRRRIAELEAADAERKRLQENQGVKIGEVLMEMGYLTRLQLERALQRQEAEMVSHMLSHRHKMLGEILVESGVITQEQLSKALAEQQTRLRQFDQNQRILEHHRSPWWRRWFRYKKEQ